MGHPAINEFCRVKSIGSLRLDVFRRMQRLFRDEVNPRLDERDLLLEENAALKAELEALKVKASKKTPATVS